MNENNQTLYMKIYESLLEKINSGELKEGDRIPTEMELAEEFQVSRITSRKALDVLSENGYITRTPGKGSFVTSISKKQEQNESNPVRIKSSSCMIGLVLPDFSASYAMDLLSGIEKEACNYNCGFTFCRTYGRQDLEEKAIDFLLEMGVDGIILMPVHGEHYNPKIFKMVLDGFPFVLVDRYLKGIPAPFIGTDNVTAAKTMTDYLLELGHRNISFISPPSVDASTIEDRMEGFVKSHKEHGIPVDEAIWITDMTCTVPGKNSGENIRDDIEKIKRLIKENPDITCFFVVEYNMALVVLQAIKAIDGRVPEDYSVVCFDGPVNYVGDYYFTHIRQQEEKMGREAVHMLIRQIERKDGHERKYIEGKLIEGSSTKKPRK